MSSEKKQTVARHISTVPVKDPETGETVFVDIFKDPSSCGFFGIDAGLIADGVDTFQSIFDRTSVLVCTAPATGVTP